MSSLLLLMVCLGGRRGLALGGRGGWCWGLCGRRQSQKIIKLNLLTWIRMLMPESCFQETFDTFLLLIVLPPLFKIYYLALPKILPLRKVNLIVKIAFLCVLSIFDQTSEKYSTMLRNLSKITKLVPDFVQQFPFCTGPFEISGIAFGPLANCWRYANATVLYSIYSSAAVCLLAWRAAFLTVIIIKSKYNQRAK